MNEAVALDRVMLLLSRASASVLFDGRTIASFDG
jgi:hypothetical protein